MRASRFGTFAPVRSVVLLSAVASTGLALSVGGVCSLATCPVDAGPG